MAGPGDRIPELSQAAPEGPFRARRDHDMALAGRQAEGRGRSIVEEQGHKGGVLAFNEPGRPAVPESISSGLRVRQHLVDDVG